MPIFLIQTDSGGVQSEKNAEIEKTSLALDAENEPVSYGGVKGVLEFDIGQHREQWLTTCHAQDWREVVETLEYRLADLECTRSYAAHAQLVRELLGQLRDECRRRGIHTELMEEDRRDAEEKTRARPR